MIPYIRNLSIKAQLSILCLIILVPLMLFQGFEIRSKYRTLYDHELQANLEIARAIRTMFVSYVNSLLRVETALIVGLTQKELTSDEISRAIKDYEDQTGIVSNISWLSPQGRVLASSIPNAIGVDISDRPHVIAVMKGQDWYISDLFLGKTSGAPSFSVLKAIRDNAGNLKGILTAAIDEDRLQKEFSFERGKSAAVSIVDRNGMAVFRYPRLDLSWEQRNWLKNYPYFREALEGREYTGIQKGIDTARIIALVPMPFGWVAGAGRPESEVTGTVLAQIQGSLVTFGSILVVALMAIVTVSKQITQSVSALQKRSDAIGRGEFVAREGIASTREFKKLSSTLDSMSEKVRVREKALRQNEEKLTAIVEQLPVEVGVLNKDGKFILSNTLLRRRIPQTMPSKDPERRPQWKAFYPDGSPIPPTEWPGARALRGETVMPGIEFQHTDGNGTLNWLVVSAVPFRTSMNEDVAAIVVLHDITESRQAEESLRQQARMLDLSGEAIFAWKLGGGIEYWNKGAETLYGYDREEAVGRVSHELLATVDPQGTMAFLRELERTGKWRGELTHRTKEGLNVVVETTQQVFPQGDQLLVLETNRDITERKQNEKELRRLNEGLEQAVQERTEKLRRLASELTLVEQRERKKLGTILHDGLQQYLVAAKMQLNGLAPKVAEERLRQSIGEIEKLLGEAVQVSRSLAAELSPPILRDAGILAGLEWLSRWKFEKYGLKVQLVMGMDAPYLAEEVKVLLFESVREILFNVVKHSGSKSAEVNLFRTSDDRLGLTVSDSGRGFETEKAIESCSQKGFGLFSIQERLQLIDGNVEIESAPGKGCRITLTVPFGKPEPLENSRTLPTEPPPASPVPVARADGKIRIVIVDDHVVMRAGLAELLSQEPDFEVIGQAADGQQAIEKTESLQPDLLLMDISMPVLDGIEATRIIHQRHPRVRVIGLSLYTEDERAREMLNAGASFYMSKSGPPSELKAAIRTCSGENSASSETSPSGRLVQ